MPVPRLLDALPELVREGLITADQADRIHMRYAAPQEQSGNRMLLLFSILGGLLIGLGLILVVAHNWEDLSRTTRTVFAFLPMAIGQGLVLFTLLKKRAVAGWKEGTAIFLMLAVGACIALISQIYHTGGELHEFLLVWSLLTVALLYVPGSLVSGLLYISMITWYAGVYRTGSWHTVQHPWLYLPMLAVVIPAYVRELRRNGSSTGFFWFNAIAAISIAIGSQLFWFDGHLEVALGIMGLAVAFCLVPLTYRSRTVRTGAWPFLGGIAVLGVLFFLSYHDIWTEIKREPGDHLGPDIWPLITMLAIGIVTYVLALRWRKPMQATWFPESLVIVLVAYGLAYVSIPVATVIINAWLLALGLHTVITGLHLDSLPRMNLGLAIISVTIALRFFDLDINDALKGVVFIALGIGFLFMNMRLLKQRKMATHA